MTPATSDVVSAHVDWVNVEDMISKPEQLRLGKAKARLDVALAEREAAIIAAHDAGATLREIGQHVGLSAAGVLKILRKAPPSDT